MSEAKGDHDIDVDVYEEQPTSAAPPAPPAGASFVQRFIHANSLRAEGMIAEALAAYSILLEESPNNVAILCSRASVYLLTNQLLEAEKDAEAAVSAQPELDEPHLLYGRVLRELRRAPSTCMCCW